MRETPGIKKYINSRYEILRDNGFDPDMESKVIKKPDEYFDPDGLKAFTNHHNKIKDYAQDKLNIPFSRTLNWTLVQSIARDIMHWAKQSFSAILKYLVKLINWWDMPKLLRKQICAVFRHRDCDTGFGDSFEKSIKAEEWSGNMTLEIMKNVLPHFPDIIPIFLKACAGRLDRKRIFLHLILTLDQTAHCYGIYSMHRFPADCPEANAALCRLQKMHPMMAARIEAITPDMMVPYTIIGVRQLLFAHLEKVERSPLRTGALIWSMQKTEAQNVLETKQAKSHHNHRSETIVQQCSRSDLQRLDYIQEQPADYLLTLAMKTVKKHRKMRSNEYVSRLNSRIDLFDEDELAIWIKLKGHNWYEPLEKKKTLDHVFGHPRVHGGFTSEELIAASQFDPNTTEDIPAVAVACAVVSKTKNKANSKKKKKKSKKSKKSKKKSP